MNKNKKTIKGLSNKYLDKWIKKGIEGDYLKLLQTERKRRDKKNE